MVDLEKLGNSGAALDISTSESERAALAKRFGFLDLPAFSARVSVDRKPGGQIIVEGRLKGRIVQACILSLDPVTQELDDAFRLVFAENLTEDRDPESGEALLNAQGDAPEPLEGNMLDVGEIVAEQLSLTADPYPRRPGIKLEDVLPKPKGGARRSAPEQRRHPFAGLAALKDKPPRGR
ncbi:YceD family protein [Reyranella sp.]|uniref:YceD family protein n=1 Tax=Reyranella sp. TaxID=1929291 RepID=UPI003C7DE419